MILTIIILSAATLLEFFDAIKAIRKDYESKLKKIAWVTVRGLITLSLGCLAVTNFLKEQENIKINATHGEFGKQKDAFIKSPIMVLGNNINQDVGNHFGEDSNLHSFYPIGFGEYLRPMEIWTENNQIMINAYIKDSKGDMVATIIDRVWDISDRSGDIDYNNDDSAFEVVSKDDRVIFQIELKKDKVYLNGIVCSEKGNCTYFDRKKGWIINSTPNARQRFIFPNQELSKPLFKYPRYQYLSIRDTQE